MKYTKPHLAKSALVAIDTQCDFALPGGAAEIPGTLDIISNMKSLLTAYRQWGLPIVHMVRLYMPDASNAELCRKGMIEDGTRIVAPGTAGAEPVTDLKPNPEVKLDADLLLSGEIQDWGKKECVIYKPRWGAFYRTPLDRHLKILGVNTLVVCGCNFPNCPRTTIYEASERDYKLVLVEDAVSGIYERGKAELRDIGVRIWSTESVLKDVGGKP